jgi:hypothetical protein
MPRVLVLAADPADTALAAQRLRESGPGTAVLEVLEVRTAVQYAEALASSVAPALVVVESALPWADATAVMLQLATHWPECKAVLLATGDCSVPANRPLGMAVHAVVGKDAAGWLALPGLVAGLLGPPKVAEDAALSGAERWSGTLEAAGVHEDPGTKEQGPTEPDEDWGASTVDLHGAPLEESDQAEEHEPALELLGHELKVAGASPVNLESALLESMGRLRVELLQRHARVRATPLPTLLIDRATVVDCLHGLIAHALECAHPRQPRVTVRAQHHAERWLLCVRDNGAGVDPLHIGEILGAGGVDDHEVDDHPFARVETIARRYSGRLWLVPERGAGTTRYLALRVEATEPSDAHFTVWYEGRPVGRVAVASPSSRRQVAAVAMTLPALRHALGARPIRDVQFLDADVVEIVA